METPQLKQTLLLAPEMTRSLSVRTGAGRFSDLLDWCTSCHLPLLNQMCLASSSASDSLAIPSWVFRSFLLLHQDFFELPNLTLQCTHVLVHPSRKAVHSSCHNAGEADRWWEAKVRLLKEEDTQYHNECAGLAGDLKAAKATKASTNEALSASRKPWSISPCQCPDGLALLPGTRKRGWNASWRCQWGCWCQRRWGNSWRWPNRHLHLQIGFG